MTGPGPTVVLDACVLYGSMVRDLLLNMAEAGLFSPRWTQAIQDEWTRNLKANRPERASNVDRTRATMERAFADSLVTGYELLIPTLTLPDPDDRHVLAAAIAADAEFIVTINLKDFPVAALSPHFVEALSPDEFVMSLASLYPGEVASAAKAMMDSMSNPQMNIQSFLESMHKNDMARFADWLLDWALRNLG